MNYVINKPSVFLHKTDDLTGEVSDELLFGNTIDVLSENDSTAYIRTDYGYCGYLSSWDICENRERGREEYESVTVYSRCDLLTECSFRLRPHMSIPKGSRIKIAQRHDGRFSECKVGQRKLYIPNYAIEKPKYESLGVGICENALSYLGAPYRWGGKNDTGIDCSGLAFMSCRLCGVEIYRDAIPDERYVYEIEESEVECGDLAYFKGHVAVMTGRNKYVHASASACRVVEGEFGKGGLYKGDVLLFARVKKSE